VNIKTAVAISIASAILLVTPIFAQESSSSTTKVRPLPPRIEARKIALDTRFALMEANLQERRLMEASKAAIFRQKLEERKLRIASHEAEIKLKIQTFKDKQKAEIASRVNTNLNRINQNQTDQMLKHLDKMSQLLDKLADRPAANQAIADARAAIDTARGAVQVQAQKDYTIAVTTETKIKLDAQAKRDQLQMDITAVRRQVIAAKQAVSNAVRVAKSGKTATESAKVKEGSSSGQQ